MAFQAVPQSASVRIQYSYGSGGVPLQTGFYVRSAITWTAITLGQLRDAIIGWWNTSLAPELMSVIVDVSVKVTDETTEFGLQVSGDANDGSRAGDRLPPQAFMLVNWLCDPGSAPRGGKTFLPGFGEADQDNGQWVDTREASVLAAMNELGPDIAAANASFALVFVSRYQGFTLVDLPNGERRKRPTKRNPALTNTLASVSVDPFVRSLHGRKFAGT